MAHRQDDGAILGGSGLPDLWYWGEWRDGEFGFDVSVLLITLDVRGIREVRAGHLAARGLGGLLVDHVEDGGLDLGPNGGGIVLCSKVGGEGETATTRWCSAVLHRR